MDGGPMSAMSPGTRRRVELLFRAEEREEVARLLAERCGNNLGFREPLDAVALERFRFAALKSSGGDLERLREAVTLAELDWRDLLVAAGFADDIHAHERWSP